MRYKTARSAYTNTSLRAGKYAIQPDIYKFIDSHPSAVFGNDEAGSATSLHTLG